MKHIGPTVGPPSLLFSFYPKNITFLKMLIQKHYEASHGPALLCKRIFIIIIVLYYIVLLVVLLII